MKLGRESSEVTCDISSWLQSSWKMEHLRLPPHGSCLQRAGTGAEENLFRDYLAILRFHHNDFSYDVKSPLHTASPNDAADPQVKL